MLKNLEQLFKSIGFHVEVNGEHLIGPYIINDNESRLIVSVLGDGEGTILNFEVIGLISPDEVQNSDHIGAFVQYLLAQNWRFSAGSVEMDTDGEVRILVELPLADSELTANQLRLILNILGRNGAELVIKGRQVLQTGSYEEDDAQASSDDPEVPSPDMIELFLRFKQLAQTSEGRAQLVALQQKKDCPPSVRMMVEVALQQSVPDEL